MRRAAAIGMFDGVHAGHRHLIGRLRAEASVRGQMPMVVTFTTHPLRLVAPDREPPLLMPVDARTAALAAEGVQVLPLEFTPELRQLSAREFMRLLHREHDVDLLLLGFNNHIGHDRLATPEAYQAAGAAEGVTVIMADELPATPGVSSSAIRELIRSGRVYEAAVLLDRPYAIVGEVTHGQELGRTIGFPTANITPTPGLLLPREGVYAGRALDLPAVVNVGRRPTVAADAPVNVEVHIIGLPEDTDLYNTVLAVELLRYLRPEHKFDSISELKKAIEADVKNAARDF